MPDVLNVRTVQRSHAERGADCDMVFVSTMPDPAYEHMPPEVHPLIDDARDVNGVIAFEPSDVCGRARMRLAVVPYGGAECVRNRDRISEATVNMASYASRVYGASVLGLGSLTVPFTRGGRQVAERAERQGLPLVVNHGDDATAVAMLDGALRIGGLKDNPATSVIVIGPGVVGKALVKLLTHYGYRVTLWGLPRHENTLHSFKDALPRPELVSLSIDESVIAEHDISFVVTSGGDFPPYLFRSNSTVFDGAIPRGTGPSTEWSERGIVRIPQAGQVNTPGMNFAHQIWGTREGELYGCAAGCAWQALQIATGAEAPENHVGPAGVPYMERVRAGFADLGWQHVGAPVPAMV